MDALQYWLWLSLLNLSPRAVTAVLQEYGDAGQAWHAPEKAFHGMRGITAREAEMLDNRDLSLAALSLRRCREQKLRILPLTDSAYPKRLKETATPPAVLFVQGELPDFNASPVLAVIGTRKASSYGLKMGRELAWQIAEGGGTVLSLLTPGADEAAAKGALLSERPCIAVLGSPHEACRWPVMKQVAAHGAVVSEYPPSRQQFRHFFRERNRVAAGLCDGVVVVEAPEKSGTWLFVTEAAEQGKDVFAVPGNADALNAAGTLSMLKDGAKLVTCGSDVLEDYFLRFPQLRMTPGDRAAAAQTPAAQTTADKTPVVQTPAAPTGTVHAPDAQSPAPQSPTAQTSVCQPASSQPPAAQTPADPGMAPDAQSDLRRQLQQLSADQLRLIAAISPPSTHVDDIAERSGLPVARVLAQLTVLEIKGYVRREPGRYFSLNI